VGDTLPILGKTPARFGVFWATPPYDTTKKSFCLRKQLKSFDFCKLFLYYLSMIGDTTIKLYYDKVGVTLGYLVWSY